MNHLRSAVLLVVLVAAGCGSSEARSADAFVEVIGNDVHFDYDVLQSPEHARQTSDLIVAGNIVDVRAGLEVWRPNSLPSCAKQAEIEASEVAKGEPASECVDSDEVLFDKYLTVVVEVSEVLSGGGAEIGDEVSMQLSIGVVSDVNELVKRSPRGPALFVLGDESDWLPTEDARFAWPDGGSRTELMMPFPDGVWFTGDDGAVGPWADATDLGSRWGLNLESVDDIAAALR